MQALPFSLLCRRVSELRNALGLYTTDQQFANSSLVVPLATMQSVFSVNGVDSVTVYAQSYEQVNTVATRLRVGLP